MKHIIGIAMLSAGLAIGAIATPAAAQEEIVLACTPPAIRNLPMSRVTAAQRNAVIACIFRRTAAEMNAQAPVPMGDGDVLQSVVAGGTTIFYNYRLNVAAEDFPPGQRRALGEQTRANVCRSNMRETVGWGGRFGYNWFDRSGRLLHDIVVDRC